MDIVAPSTLAFTLPQLSSRLSQIGATFLSRTDTINAGGDQQARELIASFLKFAEEMNADLFRERGKEVLEATAIEQGRNYTTTSITPAQQKKGFSSVGRILSQSSQSSLIASMKIVPLQDEKVTAVSCLNSPAAEAFIKNYNKDLEVENEKVIQMDSCLQEYSEEEDSAITSGLGLLAGLKMKGAIPFRLFHSTFSTTKFLKGFYNSKEGDIYGAADFNVTGDHSRVAARLSNYFLCCRNPAFGVAEQQSQKAKSYLEVPNSHSTIHQQDYAFPSPLINRETICKMVWKRLGEKSVMVTYDPLMSHPLVENKDGKEVIRATFQAVYLVTQLDARTTKVELGLHINFGGHLPRFIVNSFIVPSFNRIVSHTQAFFALSLSLNSLTKSDGKVLGEVFVNQIKAARKRGGWKKRADLSKLGVDEFLYISVAMRKLLSLYPWFRALLHEMSLNRAKASKTVKKSLPDVNDQDAINIAKGLSTIILTCTEAEAAVDHWIAQNVALEEFEKEHVWMRSFFVEIAQFSLNTSSLGLKLRVSAGALLSMVDLATDIYMTFQFLNTAGQESYGRTSALLIGLTLAIHIFLADAQNKKSSPHFFLDTFCILIGFKPALDAYRVGSGADKLDHQLMPPLMEMTFCKGIEVVFEAIPSSVVQIFALILAEERNLGALLSILVSAATIAFTSTMINYDWDTSPEKRGKMRS
ncbi:hypothetical protein TrST_g1906 [Triparma strigata]|uniref:Uncharacterized protein n=1 Tax=Triparma strigata TaxID=1606541 RepID=A0A9W7BL86_9STRA|nr:hypothetical protein TrST_g1906 [Triparma strigata]